jgi:hypothetical protein
MTLQYLCAKHCQMIQQDSVQARHLWWGAYKKGQQAAQEHDWPRATAFLGTAFEIALVCFSQDVKHCHECFSASQFAAVGRQYANALCQLKQLKAAEVCLRRLHDGLLHWSDAKSLPYAERVAAFELLPEFRQKLVALLRLSGMEAQASCLDLIAQQLTRQISRSLCH